MRKKKEWISVVLLNPFKTKVTVVSTYNYKFVYHERSVTVSPIEQNIDSSGKLGNFEPFSPRRGHD